MIGSLTEPAPAEKVDNPGELIFRSAGASPTMGAVGKSRPVNPS
jgi:hypothetical protein